MDTDEDANFGSGVGPPVVHQSQSHINQVTEKVIGAAFKVSTVLGPGFLEKVSENALAHELRTLGFEVEQQKSVPVRYEGVVVGDYTADLLVEQELILELKTVKSIDDIHLAQCINYLKASGLHVCLLMNFAKPKLEFKRIMN